MFWRRVAVLAILSLLLIPSQTGAAPPGTRAPAGLPAPSFDPQGVALEVETLLDGFDNPIHVTNAGDGSGRLFVSDRQGVVWIIEDDARLSTPFLDVSSIVRDEDGEQGFFGVEFHPDFSTNGYFFAVYTKEPAGANVLARFQVSESDPDQADVSSLLEIMVIPDSLSNHNGGDIAFGPDGYLWYATGDEGGKGDPLMRAQDPQSFFGKMLRLDVDSVEPYAIPPDNPFVDDPNVLDEIWAMGLRNPWRHSFDPVTGDLYIGDVGQDMWEEIDFVEAGTPGGLNFGWPIMEGFDCYPEDVPDCDMTGLTLPALVYSHEGPPGVRDGCSVTGGEVYRGQATPFMDGAYIFADWCEGRIWAGYRDGSGDWQMTELLDTFINWTAIGADESGELYGADMIGGRLFKFVFTRTLPLELGDVSPIGAIAGSSSIELTVTGQGFVEDAEVLWDSLAVPTSYVDQGELRATISADLIETEGIHDITVRNGPDGAITSSISFVVTQDAFGDSSFEGVWQRTDALVADGTVSRTWIWGPAPTGPARLEPYAESPDDRRLVIYFDKSRMEITNPDGDPGSIWHVTNGLLVVELMSGQMQIGDSAFEVRSSAAINVAGDADDPQGVTYDTLAGLRDSPALAEGTLITTVLASDGGTSNDGSLAQQGVRAGPLSVETGHRTASVFWDFMTSQGPVIEGGVTQEANLFQNPYFATGLPITEAYWTTVRVGGTPQQVLLQCFERRCLTYTPSNDAGWQVEAGNVGLHYYAWRYGL